MRRRQNTNSKVQPSGGQYFPGWEAIIQLVYFRKEPKWLQWRNNRLLWSGYLAVKNQIFSSMFRCLRRSEYVDIDTLYLKIAQSNSIKIMSCIMTISTARELFVKSISMGFAVALFTGWNGFMLIYMTFCATQLLMFALGFLHKNCSFWMTGRAEACRNISRRIGYIKWSMWRMAGLASFLIHGLSMRLVTRQTFRKKSMFKVAIGTNQRTVIAGKLL